MRHDLRRAPHACLHEGKEVRHLPLGQDAEGLMLPTGVNLVFTSFPYLADNLLLYWAVVSRSPDRRGLCRRYRRRVYEASAEFLLRPFFPDPSLGPFRPRSRWSLFPGLGFPRVT